MFIAANPNLHFYKGSNSGFPMAQKLESQTFVKKRINDSRDDETII